MDEIILVGGGEHARVVLDCLLSAGRRVVGLYDPKYSGQLMGVPQLGAYAPDVAKGASAVIAIGDNKTRKDVSSRVVHAMTNVVHPSVIFSPFAVMGKGCMVLHGAIVQAQSVLADHVIVNTGARVDHDCVIEQFVHLAPGSILCGNVHVGEGTLVGAGTVIIPGVTIGSWSVIGAGSVVTKDIPDFVVAVGNPARVIKMLSV